MPARTRDHRRGSSLLVTLIILCVITALVVGLLFSLSLERGNASLSNKAQSARNFSRMALDDALQSMQTALAPLDDPFGATNAPTFFWAVAPGRLDTFSLTSGASRPQKLATVDLHSGYDASKEMVDLNSTNAAGVRPIWPTQPADKKMAVNWKTVLNDPTLPASASNKIIGRYAYWVDDESSKVNINTADGTELYTKLSYGAGSPSSVRLGTVLPSLSIAQIKEIAAAALTNQFADISEVGRISNATTAQAALAATSTNRFVLTTYSRSPEFNIFNEPRFYLGSMWGGNRASNGVNGAGSVGTPRGYVPASVTTPNKTPINTSRLPLDFRVSPYSGGYQPLSSIDSPARCIYPTPWQINNANRNTFWPYLPAYSCDQPNNFPDAAYIASSAKISAALAGQSGNFAFRSNNSPERFEAARRVELYLTGTNANYQTITWPFSSDNFTGKYNLRQLDSIMIQAIDMAQSANYGEVQRAPILAPYGILGNQMVIGQGNTAKLCELLFRFTWAERTYGPDGDIDGGTLRSELFAKGYLPGYYVNPIATGPGADGYCMPNAGLDYALSGAAGGGVPAMLQPLDNLRAGIEHMNQNVSPTAVQYPVISALGYPGGSTFYYNSAVLDPTFTKVVTAVTDTNGVVHTGTTFNTNAYSSYWGDSLLYDVDQSGYSAGVDFCQMKGDEKDPDPRGAKFRRGGMGSGTMVVTSGGSPSNRWGGTLWAFYSNWLCFPPGVTLSPPNNNICFLAPGTYMTIGNSGANQTRPTRDYYSGTGMIPLISGSDAPPNWGPVRSVTMAGGWNFRYTQNGIRGLYEIVPLSSLASTVTGSATVLLTADMPSTGDTISFPSNITVSGSNPTMYVHFTVADPLVNKFAADWQVTSGNSVAPANTLGLPAGDLATLGKGTGRYWTGSTNHNSDATDMAAMWAPNGMVSFDRSGLTTQTIPQGNAPKNNIAPALNFPSIGILQYIRTKMMPDTNNGGGVPFRCLSFAGTADATQNGIPDWAMLDLFTVPQSVYDKPGNVFTSGATKVINLTYGGATSGKINPNGSALFPWAANDESFLRPEPLNAVFADLRYNRDGNPMNFSPIAAADSAQLAKDVATYIRSNGPLAMAGQICDIPAVNNYGATVNATRNDIVSQSIGLLETRSCVFSVWVVAQTVAKRPTNTSYGEFEANDLVQGEKRMRFVIERYLDLGADGVPGNTSDRGPDNVAGTLDDPADPVYNPPDPKYKYRIVNVEEIP